MLPAQNIAEAFTERTVIEPNSVVYFQLEHKLLLRLMISSGIKGKVSESSLNYGTVGKGVNTYVYPFGNEGI